MIIVFKNAGVTWMNVVACCMCRSDQNIHNPFYIIMNNDRPQRNKYMSFVRF